MEENLSRSTTPENSNSRFERSIPLPTSNRKIPSNLYQMNWGNLGLDLEKYRKNVSHIYDRLYNIRIEHLIRFNTYILDRDDIILLSDRSAVFIKNKSSGAAGAHVMDQVQSSYDYKDGVKKDFYVYPHEIIGFVKKTENFYDWKRLADLINNYKFSSVGGKNKKTSKTDTTKKFRQKTSAAKKIKIKKSSKSHKQAKL